MAKSMKAIEAHLSALVEKGIKEQAAAQKKSVDKAIGLLEQVIKELSSLRSGKRAKPARKGRKTRRAKRGRKPGKTLVTKAQIKALRKKLQLSQASFAKKLGVSMSSIRNWEAGKSKPREKVALKILALIK